MKFKPKNISLKYILIALVAVLGLYYTQFASTLSAPDTPAKNEVTEQKAPSKSSPKFTFSGTSLQGKTINISDYKGKIVVIDFWATWCPPCVAEIPHFVELQQKYPDNIQFIGISVDQTKDPVLPFIQKQNINYPIIMKTDEILEQAGDIQAIPTKFILDQNGALISKEIGYRDKSFFEQLINTAK